MLDFFKTLFANATERIKNPLIGTFAMSWMIFNWKAILVLLFSSKDIERKLTYLAENFNNLGNLLIYPLLVALCYIFLLPYINLGIDKLLSHSNSKNHKIIQENKLLAIQDNTTIAIANIGLEEAQAEYRDRAKQNEIIKALEGKIQSLEGELNHEQEKATIEHEKTLEEKNTSLNKYSGLKDEIMKYETLISNLRDENKEIRNFIINNEQLLDLSDNSFVRSLITYINELRQVLNNDKENNNLHIMNRTIPAKPRNNRKKYK